MQIESPLQKQIHNRQHIVPMIPSVAIFILFFCLWFEPITNQLNQLLATTGDWKVLCLLYLWTIHDCLLFILIYFSKILLDDSHLSDNGIYCSIINIGDVNSYWAAFRWLFVRFFKSIYRSFHYFNWIYILWNNIFHYRSNANRPAEF